MLLTIDGETLKTMADHPFYELEAAPWLAAGETRGRWTEAGDLARGDSIWQLDGTTGVVQAVELVEQPQRMYNLTVAEAHTFFVGDGQWLVHNCSPKGLIGKDFESWLAQELGGTGSFKSGAREFDVAVGNRWIEAKSGNYWVKEATPGPGFERFKSITGEQLSIAKKNNAAFEVHSNSPIPQHAKDWLTAKGITFFEHLE